MPDQYEKQIFEMNCNDCKFFERSLSDRQRHVDFHYRMQKDGFDTKRIKLLESGEKRLRNGQEEKAKAIFKEARKMSFQFSQDSCSLTFGKCKAKNKKMNFIAGILMEENINCFHHRKN